MNRGEIFWVDLAPPGGSEPGFRRPVLVVQSNAFTRSRIATVVVASITSNLRLADAPGNVLVKRRRSGLAYDSVVNVSQLTTLDKARFRESCGRLTAEQLRLVDDGLRSVLSLSGQ
jgi:mRNA interferase MazF